MSCYLMSGNPHNREWSDAYVSRHLSQLKTQGLLSSKRRGTWIWYEIDKDLADWCQKVIELIPDTVSD